MSQRLQTNEPPLLLLVHGWGLGPGVWHPLIRALSGYPCHTLDLGFFGPARLTVPAQRPLLAVGHSLGFLWLLHQLPQAPWRESCLGLVSIAGFSRFSRGDHFPAGVPPRLLTRMAQQLPVNATAVLKAFCQQGGYASCPTQTVPDPDPLLVGLDWLQHWDGRAALAAWGGPVCALAAEDDQIVAPDLTRACFATGDIQWLPDGGHLLPLTKPLLCAGHVRHCIERLAA
ncbi:MAG: alpha/beta hydrolase [Magnetococcales bacterium]|nr:alpha/beta hydrolase [Magnetococcales bacterium]